MKIAGVSGMHYVSEWLIKMNICHLKLILAIKLAFCAYPMMHFDQRLLYFDSVSTKCTD